MSAMSDAPEPDGPADPAPDPDAWAAACEEDLAAEQARRRARYGPPPTDPAEELRRLVDSVADRIGQFAAGVGVAAGPLAAQAKSALEPVIERNGEALRHLARAGEELAAAYRAAVARPGPADDRRGAEAPDGPGPVDSPDPAGTPGSPGPEGTAGADGDAPPPGGPERGEPG